MCAAGTVTTSISNPAIVRDIKSFLKLDKTAKAELSQAAIEKAWTHLSSATSMYRSLRDRVHFMHNEGCKDDLKTELASLCAEKVKIAAKYRLTLPEFSSEIQPTQLPAAVYLHCLLNYYEREDDRMNPIIAIVKSDAIHVVPKLSKVGVNFNKKYTGGKTILHLMLEECRNRRLSFTKVHQFLHQLHEIDVNVCDDNGDTPLHILFRMNTSSPEFTDLTRLFMKRGGRLDIPNKDGDTAPYTMLKRGNFTSLNRYIVGKFVKVGVDFNRKYAGGKTVLHRMLEKCQQRRFTFDQVNELLRLLPPGFDVNSCDDNGNTLMHLLAEMTERGGKIGTTMRLLNRRKTDLNIRNNDGKTVLDIASQYWRTSPTGKCYYYGVLYNLMASALTSDDKTVLHLLLEARKDANKYILYPIDHETFSPMINDLDLLNHQDTNGNTPFHIQLYTALYFVNNGKMDLQFNSYSFGDHRIWPRDCHREDNAYFGFLRRHSRVDIPNNEGETAISLVKRLCERNWGFSGLLRAIAPEEVDIMERQRCKCSIL